MDTIAIFKLTDCSLTPVQSIVSVLAHLLSNFYNATRNSFFLSSDVEGAQFTRSLKLPKFVYLHTKLESITLSLWNILNHLQNLTYLF